MKTVMSAIAAALVLAAITATSGLASSNTPSCTQSVTTPSVLADQPSRPDDLPIAYDANYPRPASMPTEPPSPNYRLGPYCYNNNKSCYDLGYTMGDRIVGDPANPPTGLYTFANGLKVYIERAFAPVSYNWVIEQGPWPVEVRVGGYMSLDGFQYVYGQSQPSDYNIYGTNSTWVQYLSFCTWALPTAVTVTDFQAHHRPRGGTVIHWNIASGGDAIGYVVVRGRYGARVGSMQFIGQKKYTVVDVKSAAIYTLKEVKLDGSIGAVLATTVPS